MIQTDLKIEYIAIQDLTPYQQNCKIHTPEQIKHIAESIRQFGFNDPLGVWGESNIILEGNGRLEALQHLEITKVPCVRLDHMDDTERKAYVIAHNHLNMETDFDQVLLLQQLDELQKDMNLGDLGIDSEKYFAKLEKLERKELKPYHQVHYLISLNINDHDKIINLLGQIKKIEGVEIDSTLG